MRHASFLFFFSWASYGRTKEARGERKEQFSRKKRNGNDCSVQSGEEGWAMTNERFARKVMRSMTSTSTQVEFPVHNLGGKIFLPTLNREFIFLSTPPLTYVSICAFSPRSLRICSASICLKALPTIVCFLPKFSSSAQGVYDCNIIPG